MTLNKLIQQAKNSSGCYLSKKEFTRAGRKFFKAVADKLNLVNKKDYDLRYNAGGIAGSGDVVLHTDHFYLHLNDFGFYWRKVAGRKDYRGEWNRHSNGEFNEGDLAAEITIAFAPNNEIDPFSYKSKDSAYNLIDSAKLGLDK